MTRCNRCHRALTNPKSIELGMGEICRARAARDGDKEAMAENQTAMLPFTGDIIVRRVIAGIETNVPHVVRRHSPTGLEWGYGGSGPADLALNALLHYTDRDTAERHYQDFKWDFIAGMANEGGVIKGERIREWLAAKAKEGTEQHA